MKVTTERLPGSLARLEIEIEPEQVNREMERAYKRLANRVQVPGFRRGKAPRVLVERSLGEGAVLQEATRELIPTAISDAVAQEQLDVIGEPEDFRMLDSEAIKFEVNVPLAPTVTLGDYKSVTAERQTAEVADEQVEEVIEQLRERELTWVTPEPPRPAEDGDQLVLDIEDFVEGEPTGEKQEDVVVVLGRGPLMESLDRQLVGVQEGQQYEFDAQLPEDHREPDVAGKDGRFKVFVKSIKQPLLPEVNDEFAARVGEGVSTAAELREKIRQNLQERAESSERDRLVADVISKIVESSEVDVPEVLVEREVEHQVEHFSERLRTQGVSLSQFLQYTNQTEQEMRDEMRDSARERVVRGLVLSEVARAEGIEVADSEIDSEVARILGRIADEEKPQARQILDGDEWRSSMRSQLYDRKLINRVVEMATGEPLDTPPEDAPATEAEAEIEDAVAMVEAEATLEEIQPVDAGARV